MIDSFDGKSPADRSLLFDRARGKGRAGCGGIANDAALALEGLSSQGIPAQPFVAKHLSYLNSQMASLVPLAMQAAAASLQARQSDG